VTRGTVVTVALRGDYGKPRPALIIQSEAFAELPSVVILPITGEIRNTPLYRLTVEPSPENGLLKLSQIMVDKPQAVGRDKVGQVIGRLDDDSMIAVTRSLALFLGIA